MPDPGYDAFISYRRSDGAQVAHWLRRELESFRLPRALRAAHPGKLRIYLDTAYERGTSDFYEQSIRPALLQSRYLLVLATPDAVLRATGAEDWIQREVADFTAGPNGANVIAVRAAGDFDGPLPADLARRFPNIEIVDLRGAGRLSFLNPVRASRLSSEKLKLVAPLIELPTDAMPALRQEEERRQQARLGAASGLSLAVLAAVSGTSIYALDSSFRAARALEDSMFATGRMIITATQNSGNDKSSLINQGCDLLDDLSEGSTSKPGLREQLICRQERSRSHEALGETKEALAQLEGAVTLAREHYVLRPRQDVGGLIVDALQSLASYHLRQKDEPGAEAVLVRMRDEAVALYDAHSGSISLAEAKAEAHAQLGDLQAAQRKNDRAAQSYEAAAEAVEQALDPVDDGRRARHQTWQVRLYRLTAEHLNATGDPTAAVVRIDHALRIARSIKPNEIKPQMLIDHAEAAAIGFLVKREIGDTAGSGHDHDEATTLLARIKSTDDVSEDARNHARAVEKWLADHQAPTLSAD